MTNDAVISVEDLRVEFTNRSLVGGAQTVRAVDGVSFDVRPGEVFCIAGESGSGKTTLGRALLGLVAPNGGRATVAGREVASARGKDLKALRRRAQMIFQDPMGSLNPRQTAYEIVAEAVRIHGLEGNEEELVAEALSRAGLRPPERFFLSYPHELSGGQRQRVIIASAVILEPDVLVADEPVSMLDASVRGEILRLLVELKQTMGLTLVLITHDLGFAWALADRVAVMYLGKIVELGPAESVLTQPLHPYTQALLAASPEIGRRSTPEMLLGEPPNASDVPPGCRFHPRCPAMHSGAAKDVEELNRTVVPDLMELAPDHFVACHLAQASAGRLRPAASRG